jgi:hypothetical protein
MSIVKRKNASGGIYYYNTTTSKFASEAAYKRSKGTGMGKIDSKFQARKGKPSKAVCSNYGGELRVQKTSTAGRNLRKCR